VKVGLAQRSFCSDRGAGEPAPLTRSRGHALTRLLLLAALLLLGLRAGVASAHALLLRSSPPADADLTQPPPTIELWFTEPLEPGFSGARLFDSAGRQLETGAVVLDPADNTHLSLPVGQLAPGIYTVAWQTLSQVDGHEWYGSFPFTVLNPDGSRPSGSAAEVGGAGRGELPLPAEAALRWLALLGGMLALGGPLFARRVVPREPAALAARAQAVVLPVLWAALALAVAGNLGQAGVQSVRLGGLEQLPAVLLGTRTGSLALGRVALAVTLGLFSLWLLPARHPALRLGLAGLLALLAALLAWSGARGEPLGWLALAVVLAGVALAVWAARGPALVRPVRLWPLLAALAALLLLGHSLNSHARAVPGSLWAVLGDYVHLLAAAAWVGGLVMLALVLWPRRAEAGPRLDYWPIVRRFSLLASASVFVLALTGLFNSLVQMPDLASLWTTAYGRVLLLKLALVAAALGVAFLNNRLVHARAQKLPEAGRLRALRRQVRVEAGLALALMLSVAVLVQTPAPRGQAPAAAQPQLPFTTTLGADDLYLHAQVAPNVAGQNRFWLHLYHESGAPIGEVQLVRLLFNYRDLPLGQSSVDLEPLGQNTFQAEGAYLNQSGNWDLSVYIRRRGLDDTLAQFSLVVPAPAGDLARSTPWQNPAPAVPAALLVAGMLLAVGLAPLLWRGPLQRLGRWRYAHVQVAGGVALVGAFALSVAGVIEWRNRPPPERANPIPATAESLALGQALYQDNCLPCHGPAGLGDGPVGRTLRPSPANLQVHMVPGVHSDAQLHIWISAGFPNSPMPAFAEALSDDEIWHVINYIRTLVPPE
jgi:copper transport protein